MRIHFNLTALLACFSVVDHNAVPGQQVEDAGEDAGDGEGDGDSGGEAQPGGDCDEETV